ncbi:oligosaccharide flippase family protein [Bradyrhizobium sp. HKCCYLS1011]|uniref:oligosaccharide flippase family protein n=1 Tax=Bradyrhizobium sp. HKCCYLS1011 TaxID=3420733 RepID=UPI003EBD410E
MTISTRTLFSGTVWTIGIYGLSTGLRTATNIVLARLLAPDIFGTMLIVYTFRMGIELISDVGINQNIVYNEHADEPEFYNTAWSLQLLRSIALWFVFIAAALPIARFYQIPVLAVVIPITSFSLVLSGLSSLSKFLLQKRMQVVRLNVYELILGFIGSAAILLFAYLTPTIWAMVYGTIFSSVVSLIGSYLLLPEIRHRFYISKRYSKEILSFGKWIFVSSIVFFLSMYVDRLYLGKVIPLELLGIYGIARSISDLSGNLTMRLGNIVLFPFVASHAQTARSKLYGELAPLRAKFLLVAALGFALFVASADFAIRLLYDQRYQSATWILPLLVLGSWFSILAYVNEAIVLGLGKPSYGAASNGTKLAILVISLPLMVGYFGVLGGVLAISLSDLARYVPILIGQRRERFSFGMQDLLFTILVFATTALLEYLRWMSGFGTSFDTLPIDWSHLTFLK